MDLLEIELLTNSIEETDKFYSLLLGFEKTHHNDQTISFKIGHSVLTFILTTITEPKYHFAFNIPFNKINESATWVSSRSKLIEVSENNTIVDFPAWNAKSLYFYDNNGNILEFIARFDLNNFSDKIFDVASIESISEIGIVVDLPLKFSDKLIGDHNLDYFHKEVDNEKFITLGDNNGLFIIVQTDRKWYPTEVHSKKHYTKIKFENKGARKEITL